MWHLQTIVSTEHATKESPDEPTSQSPQQPAYYPLASDCLEISKEARGTVQHGPKA
jgi:hypothetical protein